MSPDERKRRRAEASARWQAKNRETVNEWQRSRRRADPEENRRKVREWAMANPVAVALKTQRRRARTRSTDDGSVSVESWTAVLDSYHWLCVYCARPLVDPTMDHVDPLSRGGVHTIDNIAPACASCNRSKGRRSLLVWMAIRGRAA